MMKDVEVRGWDLYDERCSKTFKESWKSFHIYVEIVERLEALVYRSFHLSTYLNIFTGWKMLKGKNYFNVFQNYFNRIISTSFVRQIWVSTYFNGFISTYFQLYFNVYFNIFTGWKTLKDEIYFSTISTYLIRRVHWCRGKQGGASVDPAKAHRLQDDRISD